MVERKTSICCSVFTALLVLFISIGGIAMISVIIMNKNSDSVIIEDIKKNLGSKGMAEIRQSTGKKCPDGLKPIFNTLFPGTNTVCFCKKLSDGTYTIEEGGGSNCGRSTQEYFCKKQAIDPIVLFKYRNKVLCVKETEFNYEAYTPVKDKNQCPQGTRACGKDQSHFLCLSHNYTCPINFLKIEKISGTNPYVGSLPGYQNFILNDDYHLIYSHENYDGQIVAQTDWSLGDICMNPKNLEVGDLGGLEFLANYDDMVNTCPKELGPDNDTRWNEMDRYNFLTWLGENSEVFANLRESEVTGPSKLSRPLYLSKRSYLHFNKKCKTDKNLSIQANLAIMSGSEDSPSGSSKSFIIALLVFLCIMFVFALGYCICACNGSFSGNSLGICCCVLTLCVIIASILAGLCSYKAGLQSVRNPQMMTTECVDRLTADQFRYAFAKKALLFIGCGLLALFLLLGALFLCCNRSCCWVKDHPRLRRAEMRDYQALRDQNGPYGRGHEYSYNNGSSRDPYKQNMSRDFIDLTNEGGRGGWGMNSTGGNSSGDERFSYGLNYETNNNRGSNYNYWDIPGQEINEFNYSERKVND